MRYCYRILCCRVLGIDIDIVTNQKVPFQINKTEFDSRASDINASVHFTELAVRFSDIPKAQLPVFFTFPSDLHDVTIAFFKLEPICIPIVQGSGQV